MVAAALSSWLITSPIYCCLSMRMSLNFSIVCPNLIQLFIMMDVGHPNPLRFAQCVLNTLLLPSVTLAHCLPDQSDTEKGVQLD